MVCRACNIDHTDQYNYLISPCNCYGHIHKQCLAKIRVEYTDYFSDKMTICYTCFYRYNIQEVEDRICSDMSRYCMYYMIMIRDIAIAVLLLTIISGLIGYILLWISGEEILYGKCIILGIAMMSMIFPLYLVHTSNTPLVNPTGFIIILMIIFGIFGGLFAGSYYLTRHSHKVWNRLLLDKYVVIQKN